MRTKLESRIPYEDMSIRDWRKAIMTPPAYRVGNSTFRIQSQFFIVISVLGVLVFLYLYNSSDSGHEKEKLYGYGSYDLDRVRDMATLADINSTYPLTPPVAIHDKIKFRIGLVTDMDLLSKSKHESNTWEGLYLTGNLMWNPSAKSISFSWDEGGPVKLKSSFAHAGRGMELSELVTYDGKLITMDDRSGILYVIENQKVYAWVLVTQGNGKVNKGFKAEWATVKNGCLYIGSFGKEWTTPTGEFVSNDPMWIKKICKHGDIHHINWINEFKAVRRAVGIDFPGYMLHEAVVWSNIHKKWFFLPRRISTQPYDEVKDEEQGTNLLIITDESFSDIKVVHIGEAIPTHGFSSFKFIPGTNDEVIVATKSVEFKGLTATYMMAFTIDGKILLPETKFANFKYEGFEFI